MSSLIQQTNEWLEMRKNKIGASDAPVIMGVSPWKTCYQLWEEKLGIRQKDQKSVCMQRGIELEDKARACFEKKTNIIVLPQVVFHPKHNWMMASLDGMDIEQKHIVEIKCPGKEDHNLAKEGVLPEKYYPQLQHQMEVTGLDSAFYFSFDGEDGVMLEIGRNTKYITKLLSEEEKFYKCLQDFIPPELGDRDYQPKDDALWNATALEWTSIQARLLSLQKKEKELRDTLISMSHGQSSKGCGVRVCKMVRKGNIDYSSIPEIERVDLENYRKEPIECWRITKD